MAAGFFLGVLTTIIVLLILVTVDTAGYDVGKKDKNVR